MAKQKGRAAVEKKGRALERLVVEYVPLRSIKPNSYNPNRQSDHEFELLVLSVTEDGFTQPIVVQQETREFVDGEHRWTAAIVTHALKAAGLDPTPGNIAEARAKRFALLEGPTGDSEIPVVFVDMTLEQMRIATLRHNRARGTEDVELTASLLRDLRELGALDWAADSLKLSDTEMQRLLDDMPAPEALAGEEFSGAWVPEGATHASEDRQGEDAEGNLRGITAAAADRQRIAEARLAEARTEEERVAILVDRGIHRVSLTFTGEEGQLVKRVLGDHPADRLLELCTEAEKVAVA